LLDTGIRRFTLPILDESREDYEARIAKMELTNAEGTKARQDYLDYEKRMESEDREPNLQWIERKERIEHYSVFNRENEGIQGWARRIKDDLEQMKPLEPELFHACCCLPGSAKLTNDAARAQASELLDRWTYYGCERREGAVRGWLQKRMDWAP
jgi:hypothetical protein